MSETFRDRLSALRRRRRAVVAVDFFLEAAFLLCGGVGALLLADRLGFELGLSRLHARGAGPVAAAFGAALAGATLAAVLVALVRRVPAAMLAWRADKILHSDERVLTSLELGDGGSPFASLVRAQASEALDGADPSRILPWPSMGYRAGTLVALVAGALLMLVPPTARASGPAAPAAALSLTPLRGPAPLLVQAEDLTQGIVEFRRWDFGDGTPPAEAASVEHLFAVPGRFRVRLVVRGPGGASSSEAAVEVLDPRAPFADFVPEPRKGRAPLDVRFRNASRNADRFRWSFGDGSISTERDPVHRYGQPGSYTVSLEAVGPEGRDRVERKAAVRVVGPDAPLADFRAWPRKGEAPLKVSFEDSSTGKVDGWEWDFGDRLAGPDRFSTERMPLHEFRHPGRYTVRLRVRGPGGEDLQVKERYIEVTGPGDGAGGRGGGAATPGGFGIDPNLSGASKTPGRLFGDPSERPPAEFTPETVRGAPKGENLVEKVKNVYTGEETPGGASPDKPYPQVFGEYKRAAEDSMNREAIPPGLRDYVKTYFDRIRPR